VRKPLLPVFSDEAALLVQRIDVGRQGKRRHISLQTINNRTCLLSGAAMRLIHLNCIPGLLLPVLGKSFVVLRI
jgi:hypothetical protein